ncbi:MAG: tetratricopeptide repeat protein, partial [Gammaproteobacteria bacterium]|nr:tetratricopeptide repeat protein [Gammaproteobacteria bacterium]
GEVLPAEQLLAQIWGDSQIAKSNLSHVITELRHALDDPKSCPVFIQTLPRRGYRLLIAATPLIVDKVASPVIERRHGAIPGHSRKWSWASTVFRGSRLLNVSIGFLVSVWLIIQVMSITFPLLNISSRGMKFTLLCLLIGFPVVLLITWVLDLRERRVRLAQSDNPKKNYYWRRQLLIDASFLLLSFSAVALLGRSLKVAIDDENNHLAKQAAVFDVKTIANAVAVLPFSQDVSVELADYLLAGLRDELMYSLTRLNQFPVVSERAMQALPVQPSAQQIREMLGAEFIVEGRVKNAASGYQVDVSIISAMSGIQRWSTRLTAVTEELPALQQQLHLQVSNAFGFILSQAEHTSEAAETYRLTSSFAAYDAYMQAQQRLKQFDDLVSLDRAEQLLLTALEADPDFAMASASLCKLHLEKYSVLRSVEEFEMARQACQHAASLHVDQAPVYAAMGDLYRISGQNAEALQQYDKALEVNERWVDALIGKAMLLSTDRQLPQAEQLYRHAIELEPGYWQNYMSYARFLYDQGHFELAARQYERASVLKPDSSLVLNSLGAAWFFSQHFEQAIEAWQQVVKLSPAPSSYSNLGTAHYFYRNYAEAEVMYQQALASNPLDYTIMTNLADTLDVQKTRQTEANVWYEKALQLAQQNLSVNADDEALLAQIGRIQSELQQCASALAIQQRLIQQGITDFYTYYDLAIASFNCEQPVLGQQFVHQAIQGGYAKELMAADPKIPDVKP